MGRLRRVAFPQLQRRRHSLVGPGRTHLDFHLDRAHRLLRSPVQDHGQQGGMGTRQPVGPLKFGRASSSNPSELESKCHCCTSVQPKKKGIDLGRF